MSGMPGAPRTPQPDSMLNGAIIENDNGNCVYQDGTGPVRGKSATRKFVR